MDDRKRDFIVLRLATLAQLDQTLQDIKRVSGAPGPRLAAYDPPRARANDSPVRPSGRRHAWLRGYRRARRGSRDVTLATLSRYAAALGCDLQYVLVPRKPLTQILDQRAEAIARELVAKVRHSSALEGQDTSEAMGEREIAALKRRLLDGNQSRLWR